jgi:hypothetical protein
MTLKVAFGLAAGRLMPQAILPQRTEPFGAVVAVALARFPVEPMAGLAAAVAVAVIPGEPELVVPHVMVALVARAAQQVPELMEAFGVAVAGVAVVATAALVAVVKFAFGQLGDRHEKS